MRRSLLAIMLIGFLVACGQGQPGSTPPGTDTPTPLGPDSVTGVASDTQGRPIEGARVLLEPAMHEGSVEVFTDASGRYAITDLPDNVPFYIYAWHNVNYEGQNFCLRLGMPDASDYEPFAAEEGAVRNFQWQLTGTIGTPTGSEDDVHFGGNVYLDPYGDFRDGMIELTFTSTGPLIDGSAGSTFTETVNLNETDRVSDIPVGPYTVTATLVEANGNRTPLHIGTEPASHYDSQTDQAALRFTASDTCNAASGVDPLNYLFVYSPYDF